MTRRVPRVVVRRAQAGDLDAVVAMRSALLEASRHNPAHQRLLPRFHDVARRLVASQLADKRCLTLIAVLGTEPIGMLRCMLSAATPLYNPPRHGYLSSVYVKPAHRRRGVLSALMRHADRWCVGQGATHMNLHCGVENRTGNAVWKALGFEAAELLRVRKIPRRGTSAKRRLQRPNLGISPKRER